MSKFLISIRALDSWFQRQKRVLPWRDQPTPYRVWISEIMLQQTQVITVIPYFEKFVQKFPTVKDLAQASEDEVLLYWSGLGYYSRARNLHRGAKLIFEKGRFPKNKEEWLEIPGVGPYTAGAILSIAYEIPEPILDGNVERVLSRIGRVSRNQGYQEFKAKLWKISNWVIQHAYRNHLSPSNVNQALMELGAMVCTPKKPLCMLCPVLSVCKAFKSGEVSLFPPKKSPKKWVLVEEKVQCWMNASGQVLLRKRKKGEWRAGLWDFVSELPLELKVTEKKNLGEIESKHIVTRHKILRKTEIWKIQSSGTESNWQASESLASTDLRWVSMKNPEVAVGSALKKTLVKIKDFI